MRTNRIVFLIILCFLAGGLFAQSLKDNPDYRKSVELKRQSEISFEEGDYQEAKELAEESQKYSALSDQGIAMMLSRYKANSALRRFEASLNSATKINGEKNFPDEFTQGKALYETAYKQFQNESYADSYMTSLKGIELLSVIIYIPKEGTALPARYVVRKYNLTKDCLWNIAGYDFIYGNSWDWKLLWNANRDKLPQPSNPRLILPGMVLEIPSKSGEIRSGTWDNGTIK
ncbi:hypothetical protein [Oceanispirochaeta sp.]|jgi:hypothetical protein|uniref:LysM peptidoglycan-binding domain-containing protein n=1 Tax=Oceanispirochaeta sp. TaxID=2035350 RepID=UPI00261FB24B|nr:hypothetical protein [Oceanispirochaeta sp.]MDA3958659.1 hypothetical protein [Oceanispirochaeta sp.]